MNARFSFLPPASQNPLVHALSLVVGAVVLVGAFFVGAFLLVIALSIAVVFGAVIMGRFWWLKRKFLKAADSRLSGANEPTNDSGGAVIDVEYTVVEETQSNSETQSQESKRL